MIDLEKIESPEFLKSLSIKELVELASQIRQFIIDKVSENGGHLSSNLGCVELTIALHYVFDSPHDKFIFDVGHQTYTHKILTGRAKDFTNLRQLNGLSGFSRCDESEYDCFETGHSSTSIAAAAGFLEAKEHGANIGEVISIIGDGSLMNGLSLSAMNYLGSRENQKNIIILNDNDMSISKSVGNFAKILNKIRINRSYNRLKKITPRFINKLSEKMRITIKSYAYGNTFISSFGYKYIGPIDGNNIEQLIRYFKYAKEKNTSVLVHLKTKKGLGYQFSENDRLGNWHGVEPFDIATGQLKYQLKSDEVSWSSGIGELIHQKMAINDKIIAICPAMTNGSRLENIVQDFPKRIIDVGIAEELAVVMSSSLAQTGLIPFNFIYSTFLQRSYDQISHDIARSNKHVIFMIDRAGIVPNDGDTHQGIFDISYLSHLPNMTILMPRNLSEADALIDYAINVATGPVAIRYPKANTNKNYSKIKEISKPSWEIMSPISKINIISYGNDINEIYEKASTKGYGVINARFIKPLDESLIKELVDTKVYIYEEVNKEGSLGSLFLSHCNKYNLKIDVKLTSFENTYLTHGSVAELKSINSLDIDEFIINIEKESM